MQLTPGDRIDRYQLIEPLGEGGQGSVWKAVDALDPSRVVALKLVPIMHAKPNQLERVRREARGLAKLDHPSLVKCHGLFEDFKLGVLGLVLDVVDGVSLADALEDPRLSKELRWAILLHLARALAHLHEHRIIHRDLKPENIILERGFWSAPNDPTTVKVVDFGIAVEEGDPSRLTAYGTVIGTPAYMAPELIDAAHLRAGAPTPAVDVFAFGILAWQLLIGGHPTGLPPESTLVDYAVEYRRVTTGERTWAMPLAGLPEVVARCIETNPQSRLQSGEQIVATLSGARRQDTRGTLASPPSYPRTEEARPPTGFYLDPRVSTRTAAVLEPRAVQPRSRSRVAPLFSSFLLGGLLTCGVFVSAIVAWVVLSERESAPVRGATPTAVPIPAPQPTTKSNAEEPITPEPSLPPSAWWQGALRPCPSGRGCEGGCSDDIPGDDVFRLRLAGATEVLGEKKSVALNKNHPTARVCFRLARQNSPESCTGLTEIAGTAGAPQHLDVTAAELRDIGLQVTVFEGSRILARAAKLSQSYDRIALCVGASFTNTERFAGAIVVSRMDFFLDDPEKPTPSRNVKR